MNRYAENLEVVKVERLFGVGLIPKIRKTVDVKYIEVPIQDLIIDVESVDHVDVPVEASGWRLNSGSYIVTFKQTFKKQEDEDNNYEIFIDSSKNLINNGIFVINNAKYSEKEVGKNITCLIVVSNPIEIEYEASIGHIIYYYL